MRVRRAGAGALEALAAQEKGRVIGSLSRACYARFPSGVVALVAPGAHPGPIHLELDEALPLLARSAPVEYAGLDRLVVGGFEVGLAGLESWTGALHHLDRDGLSAVRDAVAPVAARSPLSSRSRPADLAEPLGFHRLAGLIGGLGPGLTPAGDDVLAGILFLTRAFFEESREGDLAAVAASVTTSDVSSAYLAWAARGQALAPAHDVLAAAAGRHDQEARSAAETLGMVGHSSGADMCLGLLWGCETLLDAGVLA